MLSYAALKLIHISTVAISGAGFMARGRGAFRGEAWVRSRAARTLPHLVDTILLLSALGMLWVIRLSPWTLPWLRAKIIGLVLYIGLGMFALRSLRRAQLSSATGSKAVPLAAWIMALLVFGYIISVALTKSPRGIFAF
jgi:uncharacterized membrane protein SirB2